MHRAYTALYHIFESWQQVMTIPFQLDNFLAAILDMCTKCMPNQGKHQGSTMDVHRVLHWEGRPSWPPLPLSATLHTFFVPWGLYWLGTKTGKIMCAFFINKCRVKNKHTDRVGEKKKFTKSEPFSGHCRGQGTPLLGPPCAHNF